MSDRSAGVAAHPGRRRGFLAPLIALAVIAIVAAVVYRATLRALAAQREQEVARLAVTDQAANERRAAAVPAGPVEGDDLTVVEGIGPRFDAVLKAAGISTYRALAEARPGRLQTILREANGRLADPSTWPEQARLAADGEWQALSELQASLKAGRRAR